MTNGEMIQKIFNCEVCEPIIEEDIIHVIFPDKNDSAIGFDWSWWNAEYKEPTTKNNLGVCVSRQAVDRLAWKYLKKPTDEHVAFYEHFLELPPITPQKPRKGHWINKQRLFINSCSAECSSCHKRSNGYVHDNGFSLEYKYYDFCPNCGAKMDEPRESEEWTDD